MALPTIRRNLGAGTTLLILLALELAGCASPPVVLSPAEWRGRLDVLTSPGATSDSAPANASTDATGVSPANAGGAVELPPNLTGPLLARSFLTYELTQGDARSWTIRYQGPERNVQSVDSWASVTLGAPGGDGPAMVRSARVYSGRVNVAMRGEKKEDGLLLHALGFTGPALFQACERLGPLSQEEFEATTDTEQVAEAYVGGFLAGFAASFTVARTDEIRRLLQSVMQWPSGAFGEDDDAPVTIRPDVLAATPCTTPFGPGWTFPVEVTAGDVQAFHGIVTVVNPGGALHLVAGVVEVRGYAPHRPDELVELRLTGAFAPRSNHLKPEAVEKLLEIKPRTRSQVLRPD